MAGPIRISILANATQARREMRGVAGDATRMGGSLSKAGRNLALAGGLVVAVRGLYSLGKAVVSSASDAEQSLGATETVFGRFADKVVSTSARAADAFGLSANEYRGSANLIGSLFRNQGVATDQLAAKSRQIIKVGADLSATFGGSAAEAVSALGATFRGEFDTVERYGISIKQSTVNTEAMRIANVRSASEFNNLSLAQQTQAKQQATTNLILKQSTRATGAFARESDTLANRQQVLAAKMENVRAKIGTALLPMLTSLADYAGDKVVPKLEDFGDWLGRNSDEISATGRSIADTLLPPLKTLGSIVTSVGGFLADLPSPIKSIAFEAGLAALILPRLNSAMFSLGNTAATTVGTLQNAERRTAAFGRAAQLAAGVGGMVALTEGAKSGNKALTGLGGALTGAAAGAALGSVFPGVGTAIGAVGGAAVGAGISLWQMSEAEQAAGDSASNAKPKLDDWTSTLDQATGAVTRHTRVLALQKLQQDGVIQQAGALGITTRDLIGSMLGQSGAMQRVNTTMKGNSDLLKGLEYGELTSFLNQNRSALLAQQTQLRHNNDELKTWGQALRGLPKGVKVALRNDGYKVTVGEVRALARQYNLNPKRLVTRLELAGVNVVKKGAGEAKKSLGEVGKTKANLAPWLRDLTGSLTSGRQQTTRGVEGINKNLHDGTGKAKADLSGFKGSLSAGIGGATVTARVGGSGVGSAMGAGFNSGIGAWVGTIAATARRAVATAIAAARAEAKTASPSKKTRQIGSDIGEGLVVGMRGKHGDAKNGGKALIRSLLSGVDDGLDGVRKSLDRVTDYVEKVSKKNDKAKLKRLRDEYGALTKNGKAQDRISAALDRQNDALRSLRDTAKGYATSIRDAIVETGNVTALGQQEDGSVSISGLLDQMRDRLVRAQRFADLIRNLTASHLNQTSLSQLLAAGAEGGLATAEAIASGGAAAIAEINNLTSQLTQQGTALGNSAADTMYSAGIKAAEGLVRGLEAEAKSLDRIADRLADRLVKQVKKALGIKSPSRVFRDLGRQTAMGLTIGLEDVHVTTAGQRLADDLTKGFGQPALDAFVAAGGAGSGSQVVEVHLSADALSEVEQGKRYMARIDLAKASGARARSF